MKARRRPGLAFPNGRVSLQTRALVTSAQSLCAMLWRAGLLSLFALNALGATADEIDDLIAKADTIKLGNRVEFGATLAALEAKKADLSTTQRQFVLYLKGWQYAYDGEYENAITTLKEVLADSGDVTLQFRSRATIVNVLMLTKRYEEGFAQLNVMNAHLPEVTNPAAREQGLAVGALCYNQVGQHDLALDYASKIAQENPTSKAICKSRQFRIEALFKSGKLREIGPELGEATQACVDSGEVIRANTVRAYEAKIYLAQDRYEEALNILTTHYDDVKATQYAHLIADYDASLAKIHLRKGEYTEARRLASDAVQRAPQLGYIAPIVAAYEVLYLEARNRRDFKASLEYHEKYAAADKGYLDDITARQLAYQRVKQQVDADKLQINTLNKQNEVLQLQEDLSRKAIENIRLYIVLLTVILAFIGLWAYRTKLSQLHFMKLSRRDGLTGVFNRPHFMDVAEQTLKSCNSLGQEVCIVVCDLDHFKRINDTFGHAAGDAVLKQGVSFFQQSLRDEDIVGRLGGEEFGVVLVNCTIHVAKERCDKLREALMTVAVTGEPDFKPSASFGVSSTALSGYELRQLLADADAALYQAKRGGRNRVVQFQSGNKSARASLDGNAHPAGA